MRRALSIAILCFWGAMVAVLVRRTWPTAVPQNGAPDAVAPALGEEWMGVYYNDEKIGYTHHLLTPDGDGFSFSEESLLRLKVMETAQTVRTRLQGRIGADFALRKVDFELSSGGGKLHASGVVGDHVLLLTLHTGQDVSEQRLPLKEPLYLPSTVRALIKAGALQPGRQVDALVFDPTALKNDRIHVTVEAQEEVPHRSPAVPAWRIREEFRGMKTTAWIDLSGAVLREEGPMGFVLISEPPERALNQGWQTATALDLVAKAAVPVAREIDDPRNRRALRVRLSGIAVDRVPQDDEQQLQESILTIHRLDLARAPSYELPYRDAAQRAEMVPTAFLQSDHPRIVTQARVALGAETDARRAAARLNDWVYAHLRKVPTISIPNALQVLDMGEGDCNEHAVLLAALGRAVGLPIRLIAGAVYLDGAFFYHAWCEVWLGRWVSIDPTFHQFPADATHIKFVVGGPDEQLAMMDIIGRLGVEVLDDTPTPDNG